MNERLSLKLDQKKRNRSDAQVFPRKIEALRDRPYTLVYGSLATEYLKWGGKQRGFLSICLDSTTDCSFQVQDG